MAPPAGLKNRSAWPGLAVAAVGPPTWNGWLLLPGPAHAWPASSPARSGLSGGIKTLRVLQHPKWPDYFSLNDFCQETVIAKHC